MNGLALRRLSPLLLSCISAGIATQPAHLDALAEPLDVIGAVGAMFAALDDALAGLAVPRLRAIAELRRRGWSYDRIADVTTLSKGRIAQLAREARQRRL